MKLFSLSCAWTNLILINYRVDPDVLSPFVPNKTYLDLYKGECLISLAGFVFSGAKTMGIPWPFHQLFEEVNLRFYVVHPHAQGPRRGVVFLKELVPNSGITFLANTLAREKYSKLPMKHLIAHGKDSIAASYSFKVKGRWNTLSATAGLLKEDIPLDSLEFFIGEHYFGYNTWYGNKTMELQLFRPPWKYQHLHTYDVDCNFAGLFPSRFLPFLSEEPHSAQFFSGSPVDMVLSRVF